MIKNLGLMFPGKVRVAYGNRIRELYGKSEHSRCVYSDFANADFLNLKDKLNIKTLEVQFSYW